MVTVLDVIVEMQKRNPDMEFYDNTHVMGLTDMADFGVVKIGVKGEDLRKLRKFKSVVVMLVVDLEEFENVTLELEGKENEENEGHETTGKTSE